MSGFQDLVGADPGMTPGPKYFGTTRPIAHGVRAFSPWWRLETNKRVEFSIYTPKA